MFTGEQSQPSTELQIKVVGEMIKNRSFYDAGDFLKYGADNFEEDMLDSMKEETYSSFRHTNALANVCCNIRSVYPESKNPFVKRNDLNATISPLVKTENTPSILWSHATDTDLENDWQPNHFVRLIPERLIRVKPSETRHYEESAILQTFSLKYHQVKVLRRKQKWHKYHRQKGLRRRNKWKKRGKWKTEEKKNKEDDHSTKKLEGSATYRCKFDKEWSKKNPCIQPVKEDAHVFFVQFAQRELVVP